MSAFAPPPRGCLVAPLVRNSLIMVVATLFGLAAGVGGYTFVYARGASYLTDDPAACANCHVMRDYYVAWQRSSHRSVAVCNDCHTPPGLVAKYATKARNGFWHSYAFTTGDFPDNMRATAHNQVVAAASCQKCHAALTLALAGVAGEVPDCARCHGAVGHPMRK